MPPFSQLVLKRAAADDPLYPLAVQGYRLTDRRDRSDGWAFPSGVSIAPRQYLLVGGTGASAWL